LLSKVQRSTDIRYPVAFFPRFILIVPTMIIDMLLGLRAQGSGPFLTPSSNTGPESSLQGSYSINFPAAGRLVQGSLAHLACGEVHRPPPTAHSDCELWRPPGAAPRATWIPMSHPTDPSHIPDLWRVFIGYSRRRPVDLP
jgi:hypothetical protein